MERIYGTLELRSVNDELREFEGIANTAALDDHGTVVEPSGARFNLPIPLLWFHDQKAPVGEVTHAALINGQWHVKGTIRTVTEPGKVKDATDEAWHSIKYKLVRGLSIGFSTLKKKGNQFIEWAWRELSLVTIPSNQEATIIAIRSAFVASSGGSSPGVSGALHTPKRQQTMTIAEQITQHENTRAAKVAARDVLLEKSGSEGRTLDETESETFDNLDIEIRSIDEHLVRLASVKKENEKRAVPVNGSSSTSSSQARGGVAVVSVRPNTEPGIGMARYAMVLARSKGNKFEAAQMATRTWGDAADEVVAVLEGRAAVAAGTTVQATFVARWSLPTSSASSSSCSVPRRCSVVSPASVTSHSTLQCRHRRRVAHTSGSVRASPSP